MRLLEQYTYKKYTLMKMSASEALCFYKPGPGHLYINDSKFENGHFSSKRFLKNKTRLNFNIYLLTLT